VLPSVVHAVRTEARRLELVVLVKPQFEAGREAVGKGGIVRDVQAQLEAVEKVRNAVLGLGATEIDVIESPILGAQGNREFLLYAIF
jgi:23S rRNA (cytidine1920-2'-O)/16S rRNA (cytidine1409-2'-O)-methyltransferase